MYSSPYETQRPYTGQALYDNGACPICGAKGACPDAAEVAMPIPPFDLHQPADPPGAPLRLYEVTVRGYPTRMQLTDSDAARYGDAAVLLS